MHAVVLRVTIKEQEASEQFLREQVVPMVSQSPGFVAGYWTRAADKSNGLSMVLYESEEAVQEAVERIQPPPDGSVTIEDRGARGRSQRLSAGRVPGRSRPP